MNEVPLLIDDSLPAARFAHPFRESWLDTGEVAIRPTQPLAELRRFVGVALIDSVQAAGLLESWVVLPQHAVSAYRESMLNLVTDRRPDGIEHIVLGASDVSDSGRALAEAALPRFYGIHLRAWSDETVQPDAHHAYLEEGAPALANIEDDGLFHEDLGRAWFLMSQTPYVSHICVAPRSLMESNRDGVQAALDRLENAKTLAHERARELRRDLTRGYGVDRELLGEVLAAQSNELAADERSGLKTLYSFTDRREAAERLASRIFEL